MSQSTKTSLRITSCGITLHAVLSGDPQVIEALVDAPYWRTLIPDVVATRTSTIPESPDIFLIGTPESFFQYEPSRQQITTDLDHIVSAIATISYIFEHARQAQECFTLHGNLVSDGNQKTIALIGGISGIGKSTLSAYIQQRGWQWLSDDKFVVNAAARCIGVMSQPLGDAKTTNAIGTQNMDTFHGDVLLSYLVIPLVTDEENLTVHYYDREKALWHIYEELSRDIRISNGLLDNFGPLPSFDTPKAAANRLNTARSYSENIPMIYLRGSCEKIFSFLREL